jgi:hypothetical protein
VTTLCAPSDLSTALPDLAPATLAALPAVLTSSIEGYCGRPLALATCSEEHTPGSTREIRVKRYPVVSVNRVMTDLAQVLAIQASPGPWRATIGLQVAGDGITLDTATGLVLTTTPGSSTTILFSAAATVQALAAAIAGVGGWSATVAPNMGPCPTAELRPVRGTFDALSRPAALQGFVTTLGDYELNPRTGKITLRVIRPVAYSFPNATFGASGQGSLVAAFYWGGYNGDATNGPVTSPADLIDACVLTARASLDCRDFSGVYQSVALGNTSFTAGQVLPIPPAAAQRLARYVDRRPS